MTDLLTLSTGFRATETDINRNENGATIIIEHDMTAAVFLCLQSEAYVLFDL